MFSNWIHLLVFAHEKDLLYTYIHTVVFPGGIRGEVLEQMQENILNLWFEIHVINSSRS